MNILNKFTSKNLKLNRKRTIVTIIGIALSTALICAVAGMVTSFQKTIVDLVKTQDGDYHISYSDIDNNQLKYIENNAEVESYFLTNQVGWAKAENSKNQYKPYFSVLEYDKNALKNYGLKLIEGKMPQSSNELVISDHIRKNGMIDLKIGDTITLDVGARKSLDGTILTGQNTYDPDESEAGLMQENIVDTGSKTYTIVGVIERPNYGIEKYSSPGYTVITYMENAGKTANVFVRYKNVQKHEEITDKILKTLKDNTGVEYETQKNQSLLAYEGAASESTMKILYGIAGIVIAIIVVSSIFVIRNSFSISVSEKNRQYGMMASVGATSKQIKKSVLFEGLIIGLIAIPLGILCGIIAIIILIWLVNIILGDMLEGTEFVYSVPLIPIAISVVISVITIYLSSVIPARRAAKIAPIEAIRGNDDIKIKAKKIKTSKFTKKAFGIGGVIASKNLKRSKKKYRTTIISIVVSIVIFISLSTFIEYGKKMTGLYYADLEFNVSVYDDNIETYKKVINLNNVKEYSYFYTNSAEVDLEIYGSEYGKEHNKETTVSNMGEMSTTKKDEVDYKTTINVVAYNNDYFKKYIKELGLKEENYKETAILADDEIQHNKDGSKIIQNYYTIKSGDTINIKLDNKDKLVKISSKTDKRPEGFENSYSTGGYLFVSEDFLANNEKTLGGLNMESNNPTELENDINNLIKIDKECSKAMVTNLDKYVQQQNRMILLISIFLYGFIAVITLIGVTNIFNTISTNMILRSKEFAMLKSVGMTTKEFKKMIRLESILYGLKSLLIGIPVGILGSFLVYNAFAQGIEFGFLMPWMSIVVSIVFVFVIVSLTMRYSLNKINKQNIIETIRKDNI